MKPTMTDPGLHEYHGGVVKNLGMNLGGSADDKRDIKEFKRFEQELYVVLLAFEQAREWADLSSVLMRLHKVFSTVPEVLSGGGRGFGGNGDGSDPLLVAQYESFYQRRLAKSNMKRTLGRRLAQCLNPQLPSGVHLNTLKIYDSIFSQIGSDGLVADLGLWSSGIFPHVANAGKQVKAAVLLLLDKHYLPLKSRLEPCMTGFVTALLPCIEDDADPNSPTVMALLRKLCDAVGEKLFCSILWLLLLKTPKIRLPGIKLLRTIVQDDVSRAARFASQTAPEFSTAIPQLSSDHFLNVTSSIGSSVDAQIGGNHASVGVVTTHSVTHTHSTLRAGSSGRQLSLHDDSRFPIGVDKLPESRIDALFPDRNILMMKTLEALLEDSNNLVKRGILDFMCTFLPLRSRVWPSLAHKIQILRQILVLLNLNDGSLNRRVTMYLTNRQDDFGGLDEDYYRLFVHRPMVAVFQQDLLLPLLSVNGGDASVLYSSGILLRPSPCGPSSGTLAGDVVVRGGVPEQEGTIGGGSKQGAIFDDWLETMQPSPNAGITVKGSTSCLRVVTYLLQEVEEIRESLVAALTIPVLLYLDTLRDLSDVRSNSFSFQRFGAKSLKTDTTPGSGAGGNVGGAAGRETEMVRATAHLSDAEAEDHLLNGANFCSREGMFSLADSSGVGGGGRGAGNSTTLHTTSTTSRLIPTVDQTFRQSQAQAHHHTARVAVRGRISIQRSEYLKVLEQGREFFENAKEKVLSALHSLWERQTQSANPDHAVYALYLHRVFIEEICEDIEIGHEIDNLVRLSFASLPLIAPTIHRLPDLYEALLFCNNVSAVFTRRQQQMAEPHSNLQSTLAKSAAGPGGHLQLEGSGQLQSVPSVRETAIAQKDDLGSVIAGCLRHFDSLIRQLMTEQVTDERIFQTYDLLSTLLVQLHEEIFKFSNILTSPESDVQYNVLPPYMESIVRASLHTPASLHGTLASDKLRLTNNSEVGLMASLHFSCRAVRTFVNLFSLSGRSGGKRTANSVHRLLRRRCRAIVPHLWQILNSSSIDLDVTIVELLIDLNSIISARQKIRTTSKRRAAGGGAGRGAGGTRARSAAAGSLLAPSKVSFGGEDYLFPRHSSMNARTTAVASRNREINAPGASATWTNLHTDVFLDADSIHPEECEEYEECEDEDDEQNDDLMMGSDCYIADVIML